MRKLQPWVAAGIVLFSQVGPAPANVLFLTDNGTDRVSRADLDGSNLQTLVDLTANPVGVAHDAANDKVYYVREGEIQRVDAGGGTPETILGAADGLVFPIDVAVAGSTLFFTDNGTDRVSRADLDGSNLQTLVQLTANPGGIAVDEAGGKVYYVREGEIQRVDMAGGTPEVILDAADGLVFPIDVAVGDSTLFLTDNGTDRVSRADLDGSNLQTLVELTVNPVGVAVDVVNDKLYFVKEWEIQRVDTSGGTPETILDGGDGLQFPLHLAIPTPPPVIEAGIDIKPGSYPNCFNINGRGVVPVAILGSAIFDVADIDRSTVLFAGLSVRLRGNGAPKCSLKDVSGDFSSTLEGEPDGFADLVCKFDDDPTAWSPDDGVACVTGELEDQTAFVGCDEICLRP